MYDQVKDKLQQQSLEKKYEGYKLEEYGLTYKVRIYIPNVADLRRVVMDEIHRAPYSSCHVPIAVTGKKDATTRLFRPG